MSALLVPIFFSFLLGVKSIKQHALFRAFVKKNGRDNVTVDDLVRAITPKGRGNKRTHRFFFVIFNMVSTIVPAVEILIFVQPFAPQHL